MSTLKVNRIEPRTGDTVEIVGLDIPEPTGGQLRAWANIKGTGTVEIRDSLNVSSVIDHGVGLHEVRLAFDMPDLNYGLGLSVVSEEPFGTTTNVVSICGDNVYKDLGGFRITSRYVHGFADYPSVYVTVFN